MGPRQRCTSLTNFQNSFRDNSKVVQKSHEWLSFRDKVILKIPLISNSKCVVLCFKCQWSVSLQRAPNLANYYTKGRRLLENSCFKGTIYNVCLLTWGFYFPIRRQRFRIHAFFLRFYRILRNARYILGNFNLTFLLEIRIILLWYVIYVVIRYISWYGQPTDR
jgi:hypothetical protein